MACENNKKKPVKVMPIYGKNIYTQTLGEEMDVENSMVAKFQEKL